MEEIITLLKDMSKKFDKIESIFNEVNIKIDGLQNGLEVNTKSLRELKEQMKKPSKQINNTEIRGYEIEKEILYLRRKVIEFKQEFLELEEYKDSVDSTLESILGKVNEIES